VPSDLAARLADRAARERLTLDEVLSSKLTVFLEILNHWNQKINLTSLTDPDEAIDRLLLEPVAAASALPRRSRLADLGSGGGSPAIPLALALEATALLMVESRSRKTAFLREAVRELGLNAIVETAQFQQVARQEEYAGSFDVVSVRGVRHDAAALSAAAALLRANGLAALFRGPDGPHMPDVTVPDLAWRDTRPLLRSTRSRLSVLFHVEQS
jgi:16S rRNA (guanine527-N7)-methyltransferase